MEEQDEITQDLQNEIEIEVGLLSNSGEYLSFHQLDSRLPEVQILSKKMRFPQRVPQIGEFILIECNDTYIVKYIYWVIRDGSARVESILVTPEDHMTFEMYNSLIAEGFAPS